MTPGTLLDVASGLALAAEAWTSSLERHRDARTGRRILATERYDAWLLQWPDGTAVSPHHHGDSDAAFAVSSGALKEIRWLDGRREERLLTRGQCASVERGVVHDVRAEVEALSVHVYSPPLARMAFFDDQAENVVFEEPVDPSHDAVIVNGTSTIGRSGGLDTVLDRARERISPRVEPRDLAAAMALGSLVVDTLSGRSPTAGRRDRRSRGHRSQRAGVATRPVRFPSNARGLGRGSTRHSRL